jgi:hypothetical protein
MMKFLMVLVLSVPMFAMAQDDGKAAMFQEAKANMLSSIESRMSNLNDAKSCVNAATDGAGLKACHEKMQAANRELKEEMKGKRKELKEKRDEWKEKKKADKNKK